MNELSLTDEQWPDLGHAQQVIPADRQKLRFCRPLNSHVRAHQYSSTNTQWCIQEAQRIGPSCHALVQALFADAVLVRLRAVQGVLRLAKSFGGARLEAACRRANHFGTPTYRAVKTILQKGLDQQPLVTAFDSLATTYTEGGRFCRDSQTLLVH